MDSLINPNLKHLLNEPVSRVRNGSASGYGFIAGDGVGCGNLYGSGSGITSPALPTMGHESYVKGSGEGIGSGFGEPNGSGSDMRLINKRGNGQGFEFGMGNGDGSAEGGGYRNGAGRGMRVKEGE